MMYANNRISTIVETQLPEFVRADHPNFVALLKKYYEYLEQDGKNQQVNKSLYDYADVDSTRADLVKYFKTKIIPNFPDETSLSKAKIIKASREFYAKKGTAESFKFLFKILYGLDIDVYFPKDDILKVSDGKWQLPQAIRLSFGDSSTRVTTGNVNVFVSSATTVSANGFSLAAAGITANSYIRIGTEKRKVVSVAGDYLLTDLPFANTGNSQIYNSADLYKVTLNQYADFDVSLLNKRKAVGEVSRTSCIIEKAIRSIDKNTGYEIAELYVSNINKLFENGENLLVDYVDTQGVAHTFSSKIISLISNIRLYRNRFGVYQTGKRYQKGDPVSIIGGLANADDTIRAVAEVGNVSTGSIQSMDVLAPGYFFRPYQNSAIRLYSGSGIGANAYVDTIWDDGGANSSNFAFNTDSIAFKMAHMIYDPTNDIYTFANTTIPTVSLSRPITLPGSANVNAAAGFANVYLTSNVSNNTTPAFNVKYSNTITIGANTFLVNVVAANGLMMTVNSISNTAYTFTYTVNNLTTTKIDLSSDYTAANQSTTRVNVNSATYIANTTPDFYKSYVIQVIGGTGRASSPNSSVILGSNANGILNLTTALGSALDGTSNVIIYANAQTQIGKAFSYSTFTLGKIRAVILKNGGSFFDAPPSTAAGTIDVDSLYDTDYSTIQGYMTIPGSTTPAGAQFSNYNTSGTYPTIQLSSSNSVYSLANGFYTGVRLWLDVGETSHYVKITDYIVNNPGSASNTKTLVLDTLFENNVTPTNITRFNMFMDFKESVRSTGQIGVVLVNNGGTGYSGSDVVQFVGTGYGATATLTVNGGGTITAITLTNRGEGYYAMPTIVINNSSGGPTAGAGASFTTIGLSDGENLSATTNDIGRIQDFNIINRGFDYASTPVVSLKNMDVLTNNLQSNQIVLVGQSVWQGGSTNVGAVFKATVDEVYRANSVYSVIRLYDYSGTVNTSLPLQVNTSSGNIAITALSQNASISFNGVNPAVDKPYPYYYGDGLAKANAEFLNGLIQYNGYYLNSDGFISADKKLQNNNYFHNFSYEIQAEKSLSEYSKTVYSTAHPAGMQLLSRYLIKDLLAVNATTRSNISLTNPSVAGTNVTAYAFDTNGRAVINGKMDGVANVGDTIWIGSALTGRYQLKIVTGVANTNTTPSLSIDFTSGVYDLFPANTTILTLESNTAFIGDGRIRTTNNSNIMYVTGNTSSLDPYITNGDYIRFNIADYRTNLLTYSEGFDQAIWGKTSSSITANTVSAPDGTTTADTFIEAAATAQHIIQQVSTPISGRDYTMSVYAKANTRRYVLVGLSGGGMGDMYVGVDLVTGLLTSTLGSPTAYSITSAGNGWWRISATKTSSSTGSMGARVWISPDGISSSYAGDGTSSIYIWGAQMEYSAAPGDYIPTTSVAVKSSKGTNTLYTANVVGISGNTIQVNTQQHLITTDSSNNLYQIFPSYVNTTYQIITSAP